MKHMEVSRRYSDAQIQHELDGVDVTILPKQIMISLSKYVNILNTPTRKLDDKLFDYNFEVEERIMKDSKDLIW